MVSPPPSYASSASVSRSNTSREELQARADSILRASLSHSVSSNSSASVSRSQVSRDELRSRADEMLRSSLSRRVSSAPAVSPPSLAFSISTTSPSTYRSERSAITTRSQLDSMSLSDNNTLVPTRPPIVESASNLPPSFASSSSRVSSSEAKLRVLSLKREVNRANAEMPVRDTAELLKEACSTDLLFLIDTTYSMDRYIDAAKEQVKKIVDDIKKAFLNESEVRVAVVGYKDHMDRPNIEFLDFTKSTDKVYYFLDKLTARGGGDMPEDVLGGIRQAINASWKQQTRCVIHIADAPGHGRELHDLPETDDDYHKSGSEPHGLTHKPLLSQLIQLNINYALLRIRDSTDRMAWVFSRAYAAATGISEVTLLPSNRYYNERNSMSINTTSSKHSTSTVVQFEEVQLGTTYSAIQHLVVKSVTTSVTRTAGRLTKELGSRIKVSSTLSTGGGSRKPAYNLTAIKEYDNVGGAKTIDLETATPQWDKPDWLDETLVVEGFGPEVVHDASTLSEMIYDDENIRLGVVELTIHARSKPFAQGSMRVASYARTAASTSRSVIKSFKDDTHGIPALAEDMRIQALCKAFALEFNRILNIEHPIDFIVTTCLQTKQKNGPGNRYISLEPYIQGEYVKYNNNELYVRDSPDDPFNCTAQAFSHFTFERSYGHLLVNDLQGVGQLLTDPSIQTKDLQRFKLSDTNIHEAGFKFFFISHKCNSICRKLQLKSNLEMFASGNFKFRERWPTMKPTVCCSNKLCRRIIHLASANKSDEFPSFRWCNSCWPQLQSSMVPWICVAPGSHHEFLVSRFFHESQGQGTPRKCPEHLEKDKTISNAAVIGGNLWNRMKSSSVSTDSFIDGSSW